MDGACRRGSSRGDTCLHGLARGTVDPCGAASVLGRRNDSRSTGHVCRQRSRSIPPCGAVPGWGMVQSSSHGMQYCWQRGPVAADSHLHFPPQHAGFLTSGVENRSHAAAKQTARIGPWKELINCFAGNYPNSKLCQRAAGSQARLTRIQDLGLFHCTLRGRAHCSRGGRARHQQHCEATLPQEQWEMQLCLQWGDWARARTRDGRACRQPQP